MKEIVLLRAATQMQPVIADSAAITEITDYINNYRSKHNSPPLVWDTTIASFSQDWANYLLSNNLFQHSGSLIYGENLAYFQGYPINMLTLIKRAIDLWYNEITLYDFANPGFSETTGHFTCLVWKASTKFAIGYSFDEISKTVEVVMNTSPPGNVAGQYKQNVLAPTTPSIPPTPSTPPAQPPVIVPPPPLPIPTPGPAPPGSVGMYDKLHVLTSLYTILHDLSHNKSKTFVMNEIRMLINDIGTL
jgi:glioma pathogenesis-related protein 2